MSKQIYIDSNGNEIQVSGTVNTADMMPMSGNDSTKVSEAIGDLSQLTTTDKSSLVGAVNEVISNKQDKLKLKSFTATTDTSGNILIPDLTVADNVIVACMSSNGYATGAIPSGNSYYFKVLSNTTPVNPAVNITTNCYVLYY